MGQILKYRCDCGYEKELAVGGGIMAIDEATVRAAFDSSELSLFSAAKSAKVLKRFMLEYEPALCPGCGILIKSPVLRYKVGEREHIVRKPCPDCGGEVVPQAHDAVTCPQCGELMDAQSAGMWD